MKDIVDEAKDIVKYIQAHQLPMEVYLIYSSNLRLKMPKSMRFSTYFLMIDRVIKVNHAFEQVVINPNWAAYMNKLSWGVIIG